MKFNNLNKLNYLEHQINRFIINLMAQICYKFPNLIALELVQSKFSRAIFQVPHWISKASLQMESGIVRMEARI